MCEICTTFNFPLQLVGFKQFTDTRLQKHRSVFMYFYLHLKWRYISKRAGWPETIENDGYEFLESLNNRGFLDE